MKICEIFTSIQGESTYAGLPCTFVRLTGCNLRCSYCDTTYAYEEGEEMSIDNIIERVSVSGMPLVEITGGEPLFQKEEVLPLIRRLCDAGYRVLVETNGSHGIDGIDDRAVVILDIKTPGSGMHDRMDMENLRRLRQHDEVKFVICSREDYEWAKVILSRYGLADRCTVLLSPVFGMLDPRSVAEWIVSDRLRARLSLQLHKYVFGPDEREV